MIVRPYYTCCILRKIGSTRQRMIHIMQRIANDHWHMCCLKSIHRYNYVDNRTHKFCTNCNLILSPVDNSLSSILAINMDLQSRHSNNQRLWDKKYNFVSHNLVCNTTVHTEYKSKFRLFVKPAHIQVDSKACIAQNNWVGGIPYYHPAK